MSISDGLTNEGKIKALELALARYIEGQDRLISTYVLKSERYRKALEQICAGGAMTHFSAHDCRIIAGKALQQKVPK